MSLVEQGRVVFDADTRDLIVPCVGGLANRVFNILGGRLLAKRLDRRFRVYWPDNVHLNARPDLLFRNPPALVSDQEMLDIVARTEWSISLFSAEHDWHSSNQEPQQNAHVVIVKSWHIPGAHSPDRISQEFNGLGFSDQVLSLAGQFSFLDFSASVVHARLGDLQKDGSITNAFPADEAYFLNAMQWMVNCGLAEKFYVSSLHDGLVKILGQRFNVTRSPSLDVPNRNEDGVIKAAAQLVVMSRFSGPMLGTPKSQFSWLTSLMRGRPVLSRHPRPGDERALMRDYWNILE